MPQLSLLSLGLLLTLVFGVALLYSSVGFGGATGYLAVMSLLALPPAAMSGTALALNVLVASTALVTFYRAGHFSRRLTLPFVLTSVPAAFLGGLINVATSVYTGLLALTLLFVGLRLLWRGNGSNSRPPSPSLQPPRPALALPVGGALGLLSGIVGIGGGVFLSPLVLLMEWGTASQAAATSAAFIVLNSIAGLAGRFARGGLMIEGQGWLLLLAAFVGGLIGSRVGAKRYSPLLARRVLGAVILIAAARLGVSLLG